MSSADRTTGHNAIGHRSRRFRAHGRLVLCAAAVLAALAGCADGTGFQPLYASKSADGTPINDKLAALDIAPIPGRVGQRIRNELIYQSTGGGTPLPSEYRVEIAIKESVTATLVKIDGNASGQVYNLDAAYRVIRISDKAVIATGQSYGRASFERMTSVFANVRARENAEDRAAKTVGEELRTRLLAHLSRPA
jgi:LPS-assembly lipoprotein